MQLGSGRECAWGTSWCGWGQGWMVVPSLKCHLWEEFTQGDILDEVI